MMLLTIVAWTKKPCNKSFENYLFRTKEKYMPKKTSVKSRTIKVHVLIALTAVNILLIFALIFKLNSMNRHIEELNEIINSSGVSYALSGDAEDIYLSQTDIEEMQASITAASISEAVKEPLSSETIAADSYAAQCMSYAKTVEAPIVRTQSNVSMRLEEMSEDNEDIKYIYDNKNSYPARMLENLVNNPEMTGYVRNYTGSTQKASGGFTESEKNEQFPLLLQWDERWGYVSYGDESVIGLSGCGPTCLSMVLFSLTRNESLTPDVLADYAMNNGYYMFGTGTMWALFEDVPQLYGVTSQKFENKDEALVMQALEEGKMLVFSVGPGDFTAYGHFVVIYGIDEDGLLMVNDPNCVYRSTLHWDYSKIKNQIKSIWSFEYYTEEIV